MGNLERKTSSGTIMDPTELSRVLHITKEVPDADLKEAVLDQVRIAKRAHSQRRL